MHWIVQDNMFRERGVDELISFLERAKISHSLHKVVPFIGEIIPDIEVEGNVIVYGAYSLRHVARTKGWTPGCFDLNEITYQTFIDHWGDHMLNSDLKICTYQQAPFYMEQGKEYFMRPTNDSKHFAGRVTILDDFLEEYHKVVILEEDDGSTLRASTEIMISTTKHILQEYRLWIVDNQIVTYSLYKQGAKVVYRNEIDEDIVQFAKQRIKEWTPIRAYVMDICRLEDGLKIVELNTFNAAGLYAADVSKLVEAIEQMEFENESQRTS